MILVTIERKNGGVTAVMEDGSRIATSSGALTSMFLFEGKDLNGEQLECFRRCSARFLCRDEALVLLSRRRMSEKELRDKLHRKDRDEDAVDYAVDWLNGNGFLNDESYAAAVARHYGGKGYGAGRVRAELSKRGVSRDYWEDAVAQMPENEEKILRFITQRLKDPTDRDEVRKIGAALYRRGYGWEEIRSAFQRLHTADPEE